MTLKCIHLPPGDGDGGSDCFALPPGDGDGDSDCSAFPPCGDGIGFDSIVLSPDDGGGGSDCAVCPSGGGCGVADGVALPPGFRFFFVSSSSGFFTVRPNTVARGGSAGFSTLSRILLRLFSPVRSIG